MAYATWSCCGCAMVRGHAVDCQERVTPMSWQSTGALSAIGPPVWPSPDASMQKSDMEGSQIPPQGSQQCESSQISGLSDVQIAVIERDHQERQWAPESGGGSYCSSDASGWP